MIKVGLNLELLIETGETRILKLVITDLDGSLLDHDSYDYSAATVALEALSSRGIPVVFCSSKTRPELLKLREEMHNTAPYVLENGAAIGGLLHQHDAIWRQQTDDMLVLGRPRDWILGKLEKLRKRYAFQFSGFHDLSDAGVATLTGLRIEQARLARQREFSEPLLWQSDDKEYQNFLECLKQEGLTAEQGGRFINIAAGCSKGAAVRKLRSLLHAPNVGDPQIIALGDSPNDASMLNEADIAVIIRSARSKEIAASGAHKVIRTEQPGPAGWNKAILQILNNT